MKKRFLFFLLIIFNFLLSSITISAQRVVNSDKIEYRNEIMYVIGEEEPFTGVVNAYYKSGKLDSVYPIKNGLQDGVTKLYYETGELQAEYPFVNGLIDGIVKEYYKNGKIDVESTYIDNIQEGMTRWYYETGELEAEFPYVNGNRHGIVNYYNKKGKVESKEFYVDAISVTETVYKKYLNNKITKEEIMNQALPEKKSSFHPLSLISFLVSILFVSLPFLIIWAFIKNKRTLPNFKALDEHKKNLLLKKLIKYNNHNISNLHSTYRLNGFGTGFYKVGSFMIEGESEKINIYVKSYSALYMPLPLTLGYIVCRGKNEIISKISKEDFKLLKEEIQEEIL